MSAPQGFKPTGPYEINIGKANNGPVQDEEALHLQTEQEQMIGREIRNGIAMESDWE